MHVVVPFTWPALGDKYPRTASLRLTILGPDNKAVQVVPGISRDATGYQLTMAAADAVYTAQLQGVGGDGTFGEPVQMSFKPIYTPPETPPAFAVGHVVPAAGMA